MKKLILILLLGPTLALAGDHWENHNGTLYWLDDNGMWYYKGPAPKNWKDPEQTKAEARERKFWAWYHSLSLDEQGLVLKLLAQNEQVAAQGRRDQVLEDIESDLARIEMDLNP